MALAFALVLLIAVLPASAVAGEASRAAPLGTIQSPSGVTRFGELDPRTLELRGPGVEMPEYHGAWSFSPDRRSVALGRSAGGRRAASAC